MKVREVMTHPVISVRPHTTVSKAAELLVSHGFGAAPVRTAEGEVLGIATEADLARDRIVPSAAEGDSGGGVSCGGGRGAEHSVSAVMTPAPLCVSPDDEVSEVALQMLRTGDHSVLVLEGARLVGIVTSRDVLGAVGEGSP
jgi:CBS domain-containing protein